MAKQRESRRTAAKRSEAAEGRRRKRYKRLESFDRDFGSVVAGVDEAGRGALAGPVVSAAVILPPGSKLYRVFDSKQLSENDREAIFDEIVGCATSVGIAFAQPATIDRDNILRATLTTMHRAVDGLRVEPEVVLIDGRDGIQREGRVIPVKKGDACSLAIAAASIIAKVARDRAMRRLHTRYPSYNFCVNKGYGTKDHLAAIGAHGVTDVHRRTFVANYVDAGTPLF